ncbi:carbohydrate ABC transporter permease [Actinomyces qiguomingii]|uniref:carbohydrate ABC transporter permease n=1 Tax=Actinomyces qiguomingii TaxID=2057800 RepID=UPI000CA06055|nr:sugar ABC transporter permease [Actinomyces qiguomingii]
MWLLLTPALLLAVMFKFIPLAEGIYYSFHKVTPYLGNTWVGLDNYAKVLGSSGFIDALGHTVILAGVQTAGSVIGGLLLALMLEGSSLGLWLTRTVVVLPVVTATAVIGEIWRIIYFPDADGFLNTILAWFHLGPFPFLDSPRTALISVAAVGIWAGAPYNMVIFLAGLAGIDRNLYEAAAVDGAGRWRRLWSIVIPSLRSSMVIVLTLAAIRALGIFTEVYVLTGGGPANSTTTWMTQVYTQGFDRSDVGVASAASILLLATTLTLTIIVRWLTARRSES